MNTASPARTRTHFYIGGEWIPARGTQVTDVHSPSTEELVGVVPVANREDVDAAVKAARLAQEEWAATTPAVRAGHLRTIADVLESRQDEIASIVSAELGAPLRLARGLHVQLPITVLRSTADLLASFAFSEVVENSVILREPIGVVAAITPWNYPMHQITAKIVPALAAGCTVVVKPAELTPLTAYALADAIHDAGLPAGVVNLISGPGSILGPHLSTHPDVDMVSFTGSVPIGAAVAKDAADSIKRVALELGGKSASLIASDISDGLLETAVKVSVANAFLNAGQTCSAWTRLLVPEDRYERVRELAAVAAGKYAPGARLGPMISEQHRARVLDYMRNAERDGAELICGGPRAGGLPHTGWYVAPTIYGRVSPGSELGQEEVFGPVLSVMTYRDDAEAIEIANGTAYGLSGAVWADDPNVAMRLAQKIKAGQIDINGAAYNPIAPFGGYKRSGNGRELGRAGIEEYLELKAVQR